MANATSEENSKKRSQKNRWQRKLAETNQALAALGENAPTEQKHMLLKHRSNYAQKLGIPLDAASAITA